MAFLMEKLSATMGLNDLQEGFTSLLDKDPQISTDCPFISDLWNYLNQSHESNKEGDAESVESNKERDEDIVLREEENGSFLRDKLTLDCLPALEFFEQVRVKLNTRDFLALMQYLLDFGVRKVSMAEMEMAVKQRFELHHPEIVHGLSNLIELYQKQINSTSASASEIKGKKKRASTETPTVERKKKQRKNTNLEEELTPSYKLVPNKQRKKFAYERRSPLNTRCQLKAIYLNGNNSNSSARTKDHYLEKLNAREDELFEQDMQMEWALSIKERAAKLLEDISKNIIKNTTPEDIDNYFTTCNYCYIENLYDVYGKQVVALVRTSPEASLPVLKKRMVKILDRVMVEKEKVKNSYEKRIYQMWRRRKQN